VSTPDTLEESPSTVKRARVEDTDMVIDPCPPEEDVLWNEFDGCDDIAIRRELVDFTRQTRMQLTQANHGCMGVLAIFGDLD
jgi:hypothetical protein